MRLWEIKKDDKWGAYPRFFLRCYFCGTELVPRHSVLHKVLKNKSHALDVSYKCPNCDWYVTFGIPITKEEFESIYRARNGYVYEPEEIWQNKEKVKSKLKALGYW